MLCSKKYLFNNLIWALCISIESIFGNLPVFVGRLLLPGGNLHVHIWLVHPCRQPFQSGKEWEDTPAQPQPYQVSKPSPLDSRSYSCDVWTAFVNSDWSKKNSYCCLVITDKLAETCCWRHPGCFSLRNNGLSPALSFWKLKVDQREIKGRRQLCPCLHVTSLDNSPVMWWSTKTEIELWKCIFSKLRTFAILISTSGLRSPSNV